MKFIITTHIAQVPHILDIPHPDAPIEIFVDDIFYKDSFFYNQKNVNLKTFCNTDRIIFLTFKEKKRVLKTRRGNLKISEDEYKSLVEIAQPDFYEDYITGIFINRTNKDEKMTIYRPQNLNELMIMAEKNSIFFTECINKITQKGEMILNDGESLNINQIENKSKCECCKDLSPGYLLHLWDTKEICAFTYIQLHNYYQLCEFLKSKN